MSIRSKTSDTDRTRQPGCGITVAGLGFSEEARMVGLDTLISTDRETIPSSCARVAGIRGLEFNLRKP